MGFGGYPSQVALIMDSIVIVAAALAEEIESPADV
jgi:hypothetical protein